MTQEAIKWIDGRILELACLVDITSSDTRMKRINEEYNALLLARTAIYKQIPEKPEIKETVKTTIRFSQSGVLTRTMYFCPVCGNVLYVQHHFEYKNGFSRWPAGSQTPSCPKCGQALNWGKDAENSAIDSPSDNP